MTGVVDNQLAKKKVWRIFAPWTTQRTGVLVGHNTPLWQGGHKGQAVVRSANDVKVTHSKFCSVLVAQGHIDRIGVV